MKKEKKEKLPKWVAVEEEQEEQAPDQRPKDPPGMGGDD